MRKLIINCHNSTLCYLNDSAILLKSGRRRSASAINMVSFYKKSHVFVIFHQYCHTLCFSLLPHKVEPVEFFSFSVFLFHNFYKQFTDISFWNHSGSTIYYS